MFLVPVFCSQCASLAVQQTRAAVSTAGRGGAGGRKATSDAQASAPPAPKAGGSGSGSGVSLGLLAASAGGGGGREQRTSKDRADRATVDQGMRAVIVGHAPG